MNDLQIAAALRASSPDAIAELFDAYGERLFRYCWSMLRNREMALLALRDTLAVAQAYIVRLADSESLGPWLYSLARAECRRRRAVPAAEADEAPVRPSQRDADSRLMAWNAVMNMGVDEFEALDLACRHDVDLALVLGLSAEEAQALLAWARQSLEWALGAEILVSRGHACPDRAEVLAGWAGTMTPSLQQRVLEHAAGCEVCGPKLPRNVSAARVFALLPAPALPPLARAEVLDFFDEHRLSAYREFAVSRTAARAEGGFPVVAGPPAAAPAPDAPSAAPRRRPRRRAGVLIAAAGAIASAAVIASAFALVGSGGRPAAVREIMPAMVAGSPTVSALGRPSGLRSSDLGPSDLGPSGSGPSGLGTAGAVQSSGRSGTARAQAAGPRLPTPPPLASTSGGRGQVMITDATQPLPPGKAPGTQKSASQEPSTPVAGGAPPSPGTLQVSTGSVALGTGSAGQLTLTAVGGAVSWSASSSSPAQVSLSSYSGTLHAGQSVTLTVAVSRGAGAGNAVISLEPPASASQIVQVSWTARPSSPGPPGPSGHPRHPRRSPPAPAPSPTSPSPTSASPSATAPSIGPSTGSASGSPTAPAPPPSS
jgi:DNA-directed RNA polymerase specialized sigma24 family protein